MTRESKVGLILGFTVLLLVGVLVADHLSRAERAQIADGRSVALVLPGDDPEPGIGWSAPPRVVVAPPAASAPLSDTPDSPQAAQTAHTAASGQGAAVDPARPPESPSPLRLANGLTAARRMADQMAQGVADFGGALGDAALSGGGVAMMQPESRDAGPGDGLIAPGLTLPVPTPRPVITLQLPIPEPVPTTYQVRPNDSLSEVSARLLGSARRWREIAALNPGLVDEDGGIIAGTVLKLPGPTSGPMSGPTSGSISTAPPDGFRAIADVLRQNAPAKPTPTATPKPGAGAQPQGRSPTKAGDQAATTQRTYTVKPGDTLIAIARRELGSADRQAEILRLNERLIDDPDEIYAGMNLRLPSR